MKEKKFSSYGMRDKILLIVGYALIGLFVLAIIVPMIYIIIASFMDPITLQNKGITFDFSKWTATAYERVISNGQIWIGFKNAVIYSLVFTVVSVGLTLLAAYRTGVQPGFRSGFEWLHKLYEEGLIDPEAFTQEWFLYKRI